jgi:hypothetical protein
MHGSSNTRTPHEALQQQNMHFHTVQLLQTAALHETVFLALCNVAPADLLFFLPFAAAAVSPCPCHLCFAAAVLVQRMLLTAFAV